MPGRLGPRLRRTFSLWLARSKPTKKKTLGFARFFRVLLLEPDRPGAIWARPDAPKLDFGGRNAQIFELFRCSRAFGANCLRHRKSTVKTNTKRTSELARDDAKSMKNHSASAFDGARCSKRARTLLRGGPGASARRPGDAFGRLLAALGSPRGASRSAFGPHLAIHKPSRARPDASRKRF